MARSGQVHFRTDSVVRTDSVDPVEVLVLGYGIHLILDKVRRGRVALNDCPRP